MSGLILDARTLAEGTGDGPVTVLAEPLSFWGGLDSATGRVIDRWHPQHGLCLTGSVLAMASGRGSSSGSSVLAEAIRLGTGPAAIVLASRDAIVTVGSMVAAELYGLRCPVVLVDPAQWQAVVRAERARVEAGEGAARVHLSPAS